MLREDILALLSDLAPLVRKRQLTRLVKRLKAAEVIETKPRYRCPECDQLLDDGERRCGDCQKFGSRVDVLGECPHCGEAVEELQ